MYKSNIKTVKQFNKKALLVAMLCGLTTSAAFAVTDTATVQVSATVGGGGTCALTVGDLAFGSYSGAEVQAPIQLGIDCGATTNETLWELTIGPGQSGNYSAMQMNEATSAAPLFYDLFYHVDVIGTSGIPVDARVMSSMGNISWPTNFFNGVIPAGQSVADGSYSDTLAVTLTF